MMRHIVVVAGLLASAAGAEPAGLFEILRTKWTAAGRSSSSTADRRSRSLFPRVIRMHTWISVCSITRRPPPPISSMGARAFSTFVQTDGPDPLFRIITDHSVSYIGDGPERPGGTGEGEWTSIIEFVMPVAHAQWNFNFTQNVDPGFIQSSMVTVENITADMTLVSTTEPFGFIGELNANVGDVIRVTSGYSASGTAPPNVSGLFNSGATLATDIIIPEPTTTSLLLCGGCLCLLTRRSRPR